ncbi:phosphotransferase family protein [Mycobacterium camsae]|uniref:phosphotransferase family protein n=1 Tax=Mycobacterium gordonae TaxID=1778 RepID=UPI00197E503A|nr:phosphotransferase family protein [Mycobacterium gordonae]
MPRFKEQNFRADCSPQNWRALSVWLGGRGMVLDADEPRQFANGLANLNYLISVDGRPVVLRRPPGGQLAEGASDMAREFRVLSRLHAYYRRAPRAIAFCDDASVLGSPFQLIEYRPGAVVSDTVPEQLAGVPNGRLADEFVTALAELHSIDLETHPDLGELGRPGGFIARQIAGWNRRAHNAFGGSPPATADHIVTWLGTAAPEPSIKPTVLHSDFKFDNVIFDATGAAAAVIDWDMSTLGDPLFDLGVTLSYWAQADDADVIRDLGLAPSLEPGFPDRKALAAKYFAAAGRKPVPVGFYLALGRLRLAIAWQQLFVLHQSGALVGPKYAAFNRVATSVLTVTADSLSTEDI